jgi:uncharacterized membrane protein YgdD (TMEM256/DUF423 family)
MRLGAANALTSLVMALYAFRMDDPAAQALVRLGASFQFMHSMSTFTCATFMNIGAEKARHAPAPFLVGSMLFSGMLYFRAAGVGIGGDLGLDVGGALMAAGWGVLFIAAGEIDR